jgi:hypothetical protein
MRMVFFFDNFLSTNLQTGNCGTQLLLLEGAIQNFAFSVLNDKASSTTLARFGFRLASAQPDH